MMKTFRTDTRKLIIQGALLTGLALSPLWSSVASAQTRELREVEANWDMFDQYCVTCHNFEDWAGSIAFDTFSPGDVANEAHTFETAIRKMRGRLMPPPGNERPSEEALDGFIASLENYLDAWADENGVNPGYTAVHRLNRTEYQNSIRDLLALDIDASDFLPPDTSSDGFDNVADVLQVSPSFMEQYLQAARSISIQAVSAEPAAADIASYDAPSLANQYRHAEGLPLGTRGGFAVEHFFPDDGEYEFNIEISSQEGSVQRSYPTWWLDSEHTFILTIDDQVVFTDKLGGTEDEDAVDRLQNSAIMEIENRFKGIRIPVSAGDHRIGLTFIERSHAESDRIVDHLSPGETFDNIPVVRGFKAIGPYNAAGNPSIPNRDRIFSCYPESPAQESACAEEILTGLARQAFRRPVDETDMAPIMSFYESGQAEAGFETGIQKGIMSILASTKFLFRSEPLPDDAEPGQPFPVTDMELASRLSFLMWSRGPDEQLISLAEEGKLSNPRELRRQVSRMLEDPRAESLTRNFAFQWLRVEDVDAIDPDPRIFPDFDDDLRRNMQDEIALFVDSIMRNDRSVLELLDADHTFLNERLARHYGVDGVRGSQFRQVTLTDEQRFGLLGKGGLQMLTSYPNRTSPVVRGAYILETFYGTPPAAPPPGVETDLDARAPGEAITTVRTRLESHREQPSCNQCHGVIDPLGLALENFNAIGQFREIDRYAGAPIDARGQLASGEPVNSVIDLRKAMLERPDQFVQALTEKLMTFALGRTVEYYDMPVVRSIVEAAEKDDYRFETIISGIVESEAFRMKSLPVEDAHGELSMIDTE